MPPDGASPTAKPAVPKKAVAKSVKTPATRTTKRAAAPATKKTSAAPVKAKAAPRTPSPASRAKVAAAKEATLKDAPAAESATGAVPTTPVARRVPGRTPATSPPASGRRPATGKRGAKALRILMVASEATGIAKTGGLADVVGALPPALAALGHHVTVVVPRYRGVDTADAAALHYAVEMGGHHYEVTALVRQTVPGVRLVLIDHPAFFDRDGIYGNGSHDYEDNPRRFAYLTLAALEFARRDGEPVDIVHGHDWPGGLASVYLRSRYADDPVLGQAASVFTIHNVAYKGLCSADWLPQLGLDWSWYTTERLEYWLHVSLLKGGIACSDVITAVSRRYAQEIQTPEVGFGFEGLLKARRDRLIGIRNGIDATVWNPATDPLLPVPYDAASVREGKAAAKRTLLETFGLPTDGSALARPLVAMISRMVDQKGLDLIADVSHDLSSLDATFVVMGEGEPWYEEMWRSLARQYPDRVAVRIGFEETLSHLIEGGADLLMMPSRFEPCGLNQMYSMRYGTVPVVRATGGLVDTVEDADSAAGTGTGFVFEEASGQALLATLRRALDVFRSEPEVWRTLQRAGMSRDFSWEASARAYLEAYEQALGRQPARRAVAAHA